ncbi:MULTISPECIES: YciI family protein [unclassified Mesorhizobium]|uniref:YciI family protein n=1 Tax=unclassified Mesorhizobium TaxID=325217 RepID=UPI001125D39C|nr:MULTISPECIES: YciI family protein [unclassified Mesorhizobium]TPL01501.1 YciI family protein [Mesorhizobium sp. B2-4-16]TPL71231.1 YciI family protein [Mesorhizobium sp. B2-4-3]
MLFAVHCLDHADALQRRLVNYDAHKAYLAGGSVTTVISGPLVAADGATMIGSLFVFSADSIEEVKAFNAADPFNAANVWQSVSINPFLLRVDNRA